MNGLRKFKNIYKTAKVRVQALKYRLMGNRQIDDDLWFELQVSPQYAPWFGFDIPALPPEEVQIRFTGKSGRNNLLEAFTFYQHVRAICKLPSNPKILDVGGGWGRVSRFFLRDTKPENIWVADCLSAAIDVLHETGNPCNIVKNDLLPPIPSFCVRPDLIFCYSVFSHMNEKHFLEWTNYLLDVLAPGGHLVFTIRGSSFISHLEQIYEGSARSYLENHVELLPEPEHIKLCYRNGEFQYLPTGGGGELTKDFYGEAIIPVSYVEENFGGALYNYAPFVAGLDQEVVVLTRRTMSVA